MTSIVEEKVEKIKKKHVLKQNAEPMALWTPFPQVNQFSILPEMRRCFREYLDGTKSVLNLIDNCNFMKTTLTETQRAELRKRKRAQQKKL